MRMPKFGRIAEFFEDYSGKLSNSRLGHTLVIIAGCVIAIHQEFTSKIDPMIMGILTTAASGSYVSSKLGDGSVQKTALPSAVPPSDDSDGDEKDAK